MNESEDMELGRALFQCTHELTIGTNITTSEDDANFNSLLLRLPTCPLRRQKVFATHVDNLSDRGKFPHVLFLVAAIGDPYLLNRLLLAGAGWDSTHNRVWQITNSEGHGIQDVLLHSIQYLHNATCDTDKELEENVCWKVGLEECLELWTDFMNQPTQYVNSRLGLNNQNN